MTRPPTFSASVGFFRETGPTSPVGPATLRTGRAVARGLGAADHDFGLGPEPGEFLVLRTIPTQAGDGLLVPRAGLAFIALSPAGHRQEEPVDGGTAGAQRHRLLQRPNRGRVIPGTVVG